MPTKTAPRKKTAAVKTLYGAPSRLTDEQLGVLVAKHLRAHPESAPVMAAAAIRELRKSVDGKRVRARLEHLTRIPAGAKAAIKK